MLGFDLCIFFHRLLQKKRHLLEPISLIKVISGLICHALTSSAIDLDDPSCRNEL
ncbi:MAG: hypothetical protein ACK6BC_05255 [Cyanobacteriota bacterium]|jgi:hypothetical protein